MSHHLKTAICGVILAFAIPNIAAARDLDGSWQRSTGTSRLNFESCGNALCGHIAWIKPGFKSPGHVGQQIFFDLHPDARGNWIGKAFNPEDGKTYAGKVAVQGDTLVTKGCILGGLICKSETWTKLG